MQTMQTSDKNIIDAYNGYHDKPPSCLHDNTLGRHSYVKLKVPTVLNYKCI